MECVHSVLTDNATFGASYEKGAVRILTAFRLHCFRALASVVSLPRSVWKLAPRPMRGFFTRPDLQQQQTRKTPAKGDLAGEVWDTSGRDCLWSDSDQAARLLTSRLAVIRQHHKLLTCGAVAQLDDVALRSALGELRSL